MTSSRWKPPRDQRQAQGFEGWAAKKARGQGPRKRRSRKSRRRVAERVSQAVMASRWVVVVGSRVVGLEALPKMVWARL